MSMTNEGCAKDDPAGSKTISSAWVDELLGDDELDMLELSELCDCADKEDSELSEELDEFADDEDCEETDDRLEELDDELIEDTDDIELSELEELSAVCNSYAPMSILCPIIRGFPSRSYWSKYPAT